MAEDKKTKTISVKHKRFADLYLIYLHTKRAAIEAGYSAATAAQAGYTIKNRPEVREYIAEQMDLRWGVTRFSLVEMLTDVLELNPSDYCDQTSFGWTFKLDLEIPEHIGRLVKAMKPGPPGAQPSVEFISKEFAVQQLAKLLPPEAERGAANGGINITFSDSDLDL